MLSNRIEKERLIFFSTNDDAEKAKWFRKCFGGGIRQCGSLAVAASYALEHNLPLVSGTHLKATHLAQSFAALGIRLLLPTETHMVWFDPTPLGFTVEELAVRAKTRGITLGGTRIVVHLQITDEAIEQLILCAKELKTERINVVEERDEEEEMEYHVNGVENEKFARGDWSSMQSPRKIKRLGAKQVYAQSTK